MSISQEKISNLISAIRKQFPDWKDFSDPLLENEDALSRNVISKAQELIKREELVFLLEQKNFEEIINRFKMAGEEYKLRRKYLKSFNRNRVDKESICKAIFDLLYGIEPSHERIGRFVENVSKIRYATNNWIQATYFLFLTNPGTEVFVEPSVFEWYLKNVITPSKKLPNLGSSGYRELKEIMNELFEALVDLSPKDLYDVQIFVWAISKYNTVVSGIKNGTDIVKHNGMNIWWVNQGSTLSKELEKGIIWAPLRNSQGKYLYHWETMGEVKVNDIILHYANGSLRYVSRVISPAEITKNLHKADGPWDSEGRCIKVEYHELVPNISLQGFSQELLDLNISQGPIDSTGKVKQGYLFRFNTRGLQIIQDSQTETKWPDFVALYRPSVWVFQSNPRLFDLTGALSSLKEFSWVVLQNSQQIKTGDKVYLWESGKNSGVAGIATVITDPKELEYDESEADYYLDDEKFQGDKLRVKLRVETVLPNRITRESLLSHPVLQNLSIVKIPRGTNFPVTSEQDKELTILIKEVIKSRTINPEYPLSECAIKAGIEEEELSRWIRALERKKQAIIYGPPGTGKTYIARLLADHLIGSNDGFFEIVQFHPSYAYEDFIQGIRPQTDEDMKLSYPLVPGRFLKFCEEAQKRQGRCVLIIDEINRARLSSVFGELMFLLEYRNESIPLAGGGELFKIPENVRILGTMNTADRSIALVDHALRRRFASIPLYPQYEVLRKYHEDKDFPVDELINVLKQLNNLIGDPNYEVGISYFLHPELKQEIEDIWRMEIEPYLVEYFFDQPEKAESYRWEKIGKKIIL